MFLCKDVDTSSNNFWMFERIIEGKVWENVKHKKRAYENERQKKRTKREKKMKCKNE